MTSNRARIGVARVLRSRAPARSTPGCNYPGAVSNVARISAKTGAIERLVDIKGPLIYTVTSLAGTRRIATSITRPTTARTAIWSGSIRRRTHQACCRRICAIGDLAYNAADQSLWGIRHLNGLATLVRIKPPYTDWERVDHLAVRHGDVRPRRVARRHARVGIVRRDQRQTGRPRVRHRRVARRRHRRRSCASTSTRPCPMASSSLPTDATSTAARITPACRTSSATTSRRRRSKRVSNTETGFFRPVPLADGRLLVFRYTGQGFVPAWIDPKPLEDVSADRVSRRAADRANGRC